MEETRYTPKNRVYPQKHSHYTPEVAKSISNILKSLEKDEKAVAKHSLSLQFQTISGLFALYTQFNSSVYDIS